MPTLYSVGDASAAVAISAAISVAATIATARVAGLIYQRAILRTGARVRVRTLLRGEGARG